MQITSDLPVEQALVRAIIIRADGTREDQGVVAYTHRSKWRRLAWRLHLGRNLLAPPPRG